MPKSSVGYVDTDQAIRKFVGAEYKKYFPVESTGKFKAIGRPPVFLHEAGFYALAFTSQLPEAKKFRDWVLSKVLPSIRKYGQYKLFENPNSNMFKIENEADLHCKVVEYIRRFYPEVIMESSEHN